MHKKTISSDFISLILEGLDILIPFCIVDMGGLFSGKPTGRKVGTGRENGRVIKNKQTRLFYNFIRQPMLFYEESNYIHV